MLNHLLKSTAIFNPSFFCSALFKPDRKSLLLSNFTLSLHCIRRKQHFPGVTHGWMKLNIRQNKQMVICLKLNLSGKSSLSMFPLLKPHSADF